MSFDYTTTRQDTGRTTYDGLIVWGQAFAGTLTAAPGTETSALLVAPASGGELIPLRVFGRISRGDSPYMTVPYCRGSQQYASVSSGGTFGNGINLYTMTLAQRINASYEVYLDWTDGTLR